MESAIDVSANLFVSPSSVYRYTERFLATGDVRPFIKKNGPAKDLCEYEELLLVNLALARPGIYLREMQEQLYSSTMHWVDVSTICRALHRNGLSRQKNEALFIGYLRD